jgi:PilZ domain
VGSRKYARVGIDCPLSFAAEEPSGSVLTEEKGTTCDLSWNGCAILSGTPMEKGSYLRLKIALPGHDSELDIDLAKVRWASPHRFGVEFLVLNPQEQARLRGFVTSRHDSESVAS